MAMPVSKHNNARTWELVKEIDAYIKDNDVIDWELDFISDMMERVGNRGYSLGQIVRIIRIWEKYCL